MCYEVQRIDPAPFTARLNMARISGPLRVVPAPYVQSQAFRASGIAGCLRMVGYRMSKASITHDTYNPDYTLAADQGTALHTRLQEQLVDSGLAVLHQGRPAIEVAIETPQLTGHIDAVIRTKAGALAIFDLKSVSARYLTPGYRYLTDKVQSYAVQVSAYMQAFRMDGGEQAAEAFVLMVSRDDTSDRALFRVPWQPERWAVDEARISAARTAIAGGGLPRAEPGACRFCAYRGHCVANTWEDDS